MLESKELEELTYRDIQEFVELKIEEGTRLDYKQEVTDKLPSHVSAMANTQGGHVLIGVAEEEAERGNLKLNVPKDDIPGVEHGGKDLRAQCRDKIASRTNPRLVPNIKVVPVEDDSSRTVIVIRVEASTNAPHEVSLGEDPKILVRRADSTKVATLDEIERLIERRNRSREARFGEIEVSMPSAYFRRDARYQDELPKISVLMRPKRVAAASFTPDHRLDEDLKTLALELELMDTVDKRPIARGSALEQRASQPLRGNTLTRLEVRTNGEIRAAQTVKIDTRAHMDSSGGQEQAVQIRTLNFTDVVYFLQRAIVFASRSHDLDDRKLELEVYFQLEGCHGCRVEIPVVSEPRPLGSQKAEIWSTPLSSASVGKEPGKADLLCVVREASRACGLSVPDWRLEEYVWDFE